MNYLAFRDALITPNTSTVGGQEQGSIQCNIVKNVSTNIWNFVNNVFAIDQFIYLK